MNHVGGIRFEGRGELIAGADQETLVGHQGAQSLHKEAKKSGNFSNQICRNLLTQLTIEKRQNQMAVFMLPAPIPSGGGADELHCDHKYKKATKYMNVQRAATMDCH